MSFLRSLLSLSQMYTSIHTSMLLDTLISNNQTIIWTMMVGLLLALQHESTQSNHQLLIISKSVKAQCATTANRCCYQDRKPSTPTSGQHTETTHIFFRTTIFLNSPSPTRAMAIFHTDEDIPSWWVPFFRFFFFQYVLTWSPVSVNNFYCFSCISFLSGMHSRSRFLSYDGVLCNGFLHCLWSDWVLRIFVFVN